MIKFFNYNNHTGKLELNKDELLLINEFNALLDSNRNKCKEDPEGIYKLRAFKEFKYIYLMLDWQSPYSDFPERTRNKEALKQSELTDEEYNDEVFKIACRKYKEIIESFRTYKLLQSVYSVVDKLIIYFTKLVDFSETNDETGQLLYKAKDVIAEIKGIGPLLDEIRESENRLRKDIEKQNKIKGDYVPGYFD